MTLHPVVRRLAAVAAHRGAWLALAASGLVLEACALYFQYVMQLNPCVMCIYIRVAVFGLVAAGLVGAIAPRRAPIRVLGFAAWAVAAAQGLLLSRELIAIQAADPYSFEATCSFLPKFPAWAPLHEWWPAVFMPTGSCTDHVWSWQGLTMAEWLQGVFAAQLAVLLVFAAASVLAASRPAGAGAA